MDNPNKRLDMMSQLDRSSWYRLNNIIYKKL